jgi:hypothetical protein
MLAGVATPAVGKSIKQSATEVLPRAVQSDG